MYYYALSVYYCYFSSEEEPDSPDNSDNLPTPRNINNNEGRINPLPDLNTPGSSIEMALTEASVALAQGRGAYTPDVSYNSESSVVKRTAFLVCVFNTQLIHWNCCFDIKVHVTFIHNIHV